MKKQITETSFLQTSAAYCSASEHCCSEIRKKASNAGLDKAATERIINQLIQEKFIDENRYCKSFVNDKFQFNKWGKIKLSYELRKKEIDTQIIQKALDSINEEKYLLVLEKLLKEKLKTIKGKDNREINYKLMKYAASKGFESNKIILCLKKILKNEFEDEDFT